jgi:hypothetical protein
MENTHKPMKNRKTTFALWALIVFPLMLTLSMWAILPSGYQRYKERRNHVHEIPSRNPLVAGIKPLTFFLWQ